MSSIDLQQPDLTSQKAEGTKEGFSLEANALTGADAAMLPCITRRAMASEHPRWWADTINTVLLYKKRRDIDSQLC